MSAPFRAISSRATSLLAVALLLASCADGPSPADVSESGSPEGTSTATIALQTSYVAPVSRVSSTPAVERVRARVHRADDDELLTTHTQDVDPGAETWTLEIEVELPASGRARVYLTLELLATSADPPMVLWSGETDPVEVRAETTQEVAEVALAPGPLANRTVRSVRIEGAPAVISPGETVGLRASMTPPTDGAQVLWSSLDGDVLEVAADGTVRGVAPGRGRIVAVAGEAADTVEIQVRPPVASIVVTPGSRTLRRVGATAVFSARVLDADGDAVPGVEPTWSVTDPSVATVDDAGVVTAVGPGETGVVATVDGVSDTATVSVEIPEDDGDQVAAVQVSPASATLEGVPRTVRFQAEALDENGDVVRAVRFSWSVEDPAVATIDDNGVARSVGAGETTVRATLASIGNEDVDPDGAPFGEATLAVEAADQGGAGVDDVAAVEVSPETATIQGVPRTERFQAEALDENGEVVRGARFTWSVDDPEVATIGNNGTARSVAPGETTVRATLASVGNEDADPDDAPFGEATLTVEAADQGGAGVDDVAAVEVSPETATIQGVSRTERFQATALDENGDVVRGARFTWSVGDPEVATIGNNGTARSVAPGETTIRATLASVGNEDADPDDAPFGEATLTVEAADDGDDGGGGGGGGGGSVASVDVSPNSATLDRIGARLNLKVTVLDDQGEEIRNPDVSWSSGNTDVATVSGNGLVTATGSGTTTITATVDGVEGTMTVTVDPR